MNGPNLDPPEDEHGYCDGERDCGHPECEECLIARRIEEREEDAAYQAEEDRRYRDEGGPL